jgi:hypothetical protein
MEITDIHIVFHPAAVQYMFFSAAHETFSSLSKYKKDEITFCIFSDHSGIKLDLNNKRNYRK